MDRLRERRRNILVGSTSVAAVAESFLDSCASDPSAVRSLVFMDPELVREEARALDDRARGVDPESGDLPLLGTVVGAKDLIDVRGMPTLCGATVVSPHRRSNDAPIVARLRDAGALIVAKTTSHEFGLGAASPPARHPLVPDRLAGGSSGGSAMGVASGLLDLALATDSVGSTREPASLCGILGLRTRGGSIPNEGVQQLTGSLSAVGLMAPTLDALEATWDAVRPEVGTRDYGPVSPTFGVPSQFLTRSGEEASWIFRGAMNRLEATGVRCSEVDLEGLDAVEAAVLLVMGREGLERHGGKVLASGPGEVDVTTRRYLGHASQIDDEVYARALDVIERFRAHVGELRGSFTALLTPGQYLPAPMVTDSEVVVRGVWWSRDLALIDPYLAISGLNEPSLAVPIGAFSEYGLPMGAQLIGLRDERQLFDDARAVMAATGSDTWVASGLRREV